MPEMIDGVETHHMIGLAASHLRQSLIDLMELELDRQKSNTYVYRRNSSLPVFYDKFEVGFFMPVCAPDVMPPDCPEDIVRVMDFARRLGFSWIMFDNDIEPIADLIHYDGNTVFVPQEETEDQTPIILSPPGGDHGGR